MPLWPDPAEPVVWPPRHGLPVEAISDFGDPADATIRRPYPARSHMVETDG